jgi:hypothetical protein
MRFYLTEILGITGRIQIAAVESGGGPRERLSRGLEGA